MYNSSLRPTVPPPHHHRHAHALVQPDGLQVELLRLATLLLSHVPHGFSAHHTKQLITWSWRHLRRDNPAIVSHALLTTSTYLALNASPENVVHQVCSVCVDWGGEGRGDSFIVG
jgi:hypothetical protein